MLPNQQNLQKTMLDADQLSSLQHTIGSYSALQLAWASGYLAAKSEGASAGVSPSVVAAPAATLTILFGS
ncbi:MAG: sulfite reductase (NADPH) flavoprotein alpha-component, partial [Colwellia sp.]